MKYHILFSLLATTFIITGCTTTKSIKYPVHGQNTTISVSSEQISAMTESGAGDYFISDSQITVGDASKATSNPAPIDAFFDGVMVMADDAELKANRLRLLAQLRGLFISVADISVLQH